MNEIRPRIAVTIGLVLLVTSTVTPALATPTMETVDSTGDAPVAQMGAANNSTASHENPAEVRADGNLTAVRSWLAGRIGSALADCARRTDPAANGSCVALGEASAYPSLTGRYSEVARLTDDPGDDNASRVLNRTADRQFEFVQAVVRYRTTLRTYREARQQGQVRRARALARRVSRQGGDVVTTGERLLVDYRIISGNSSIPVSQARSTVSATLSNTSATTEEIRTTSFNPPRLTLSRNVTRASFDDPAVVRGQLRDADDGSPLSGRPIVVETPEATLRTETDADGAFAVPYRPTSAPVGNATVVVRYQPRDDSEYTPIENRTNVSVRASEATLRLNETTSTVAFGDELRVRGRLGADGVGAANASIVVSVGDVRLATAETNGTGDFVATGRLPAAVPSGSPRLTVSLAPGDRALRAEPVSRSVEVERTTPRLTIGTERLNADTARVFGGMRVGATPVADASVAIRRNGNPVATVPLSEEGSFERNVSILDVPANETAMLTIVYDPPDGNLEPLELQVQVRSVAEGLPDVPNVEGAVIDRLQPLLRLDPVPFAAGGLALLLLFLVASGAAFRSRDGSLFAGVTRPVAGIGALIGSDSGDAEAGGATDVSPPESDRVSDGSAADAAVEDDEGTFMEVAQSRFTDGRTDDAVIVAYGAVRRHLQSRIDVDPSLTHWELLAVHRDALDGEGRDALGQLTAAYESAAFSPARSTVETARTSLDSAARILGQERVGEGGEGPSNADD